MGIVKMGNLIYAKQCKQLRYGTYFKQNSANILDFE